MRQIWRVWFAQLRLVAGTIRGTLVSRATFWFSAAACDEFRAKVRDFCEITWRVQLAGWRVVYEPNAIVWILMPETLRGLWRQRLRWAEGGVR